MKALTFQFITYSLNYQPLFGSEPAHLPGRHEDWTRKSGRNSPIIVYDPRYNTDQKRLPKANITSASKYKESHKNISSNQ